MILKRQIKKRIKENSPLGKVKIQKIIHEPSHEIILVFYTVKTTFKHARGKGTIMKSWRCAGISDQGTPFGGWDLITKQESRKL
jgi:hypothetical protein